MIPPLPDLDTALETLAAAIAPAITPDTALVGIHTGGVWVAEWLHARLGLSQPLGTLNIAFYRDDFSRIGLHPTVTPSHVPLNVEDHPILLVDDVLYTGRTVRAAMNELFDYGRAASIRLAVLLERNGRELPIQADFIGASVRLPTSANLQLLRDVHGGLSLELRG
jgi:pyrimidine operon attenuation protein/uracil phosphoribosyltransferase